MSDTLIYRLRPCNKTTIDELTRNYLWFSNPTEFKDPEDANIISFAEKNKIIQDTLEKLYINLNIVKEFYENIGICCFTKKLPSKRSWKKFPKCQDGIAIEYDKTLIENIFSSVFGINACFKKVEYSKNPTIFNTSRPNDILWETKNGNYHYKSLASLDERDLDKIFLKMLTRINEKFKPQNEYRIILNYELAKTYAEIDRKGFKVRLHDFSIKKIYYKKNISDEFLEDLKNLSLELIQL